MKQISKDFFVCVGGQPKKKKESFSSAWIFSFGRKRRRGGKKPRVAGGRLVPASLVLCVCCAVLHLKALACVFVRVAVACEIALFMAST